MNIAELECQSRASGAAAAGLWAGRPVVVAGGRRGGVLVWGVAAERPLARFDDLDTTPTEFALTSVNGRTQSSRREGGPSCWETRSPARGESRSPSPGARSTA